MQNFYLCSEAGMRIDIMTERRIMPWCTLPTPT